MCSPFCQLAGMGLVLSLDIGYWSKPLLREAKMLKTNEWIYEEIWVDESFDENFVTIAKLIMTTNLWPWPQSGSMKCTRRFLRKGTNHNHHHNHHHLVNYSACCLYCILFEICMLIVIQGSRCYLRYLWRSHERRSHPSMLE